MNRFLTFFLAASCLTAVGQTEYPYNPDENGDGLIGVADLQGLLALYGLQINSDSVVVYNLSELQEPEFCSYHPNNCNDYEREVPADADIVMNDLPWNVHLILPEVPRTMILVGVAKQGQGLQSYGYGVSGEPSVQNAGFVFEYMNSGSRRIAILTGFDGEWWQLY